MKTRLFSRRVLGGLLALVPLAPDASAEPVISEFLASNTRTLADAKRLTRLLLSRLLEGQELRTRQILVDLHRL